MRIRALPLALLLGQSVGCSWLFGESEPHFTESTLLTAPWDALGLPVGDAKVTFSDADTLSVHHAASDPKSLARDYGASLSARGWTLDADTSAGSIINQTWVDDEGSMALSIMDHDGVLVVSLSRLPF